jgi:succinate dehydrogenase hydrophobic anchor subunit
VSRAGAAANTAAAVPGAPARLLRSFTILTLVLYAGYLVRTISDAPHNAAPHVVIGAMFAGSSIALAWLAQRAWTAPFQKGLRVVLVLVLAYHALFGVAMLVHRIRSESTSNQDFVMRLWPHVVGAINSLE